VSAKHVHARDTRGGGPRMRKLLHVLIQIRYAHIGRTALTPARFYKTWIYTWPAVTLRPERERDERRRPVPRMGSRARVWRDLI